MIFVFLLGVYSILQNYKVHSKVVKSIIAFAFLKITCFFNSSEGYYMYIEASHMVYGQKALLLSRPLRGVPGTHCLTFFYHMYGAGTGLLSVYLREGGGRGETLLWRRRGEQSISWLRAQVQYSGPRQHQVSKDISIEQRQPGTSASHVLCSAGLGQRECFVLFQGHGQRQDSFKSKRNWFKY